MLSLLSSENFEGFAVTKMMLNALPSMIHEDSQLVLDFFDKNIYYPLLLEHSITVNWPDNLPEFTFDCKTSLISSETI